MVDAALLDIRTHEDGSSSIHYPESDGQPLGDTDIHRDEITSIVQALEHHFAEAPDVYVSGDLLIYYVEGDPTKRR